MLITFTEIAWEDYVYWQSTDKNVVKKINRLIKDIKRNPFYGRGKPEALKYDLTGYWSRRIEHEHRLVYQVVDKRVLVYSCRFHYD
ncbi:MAG: Txe/YoeB family addiction module toxin [Bacteroidota bacterium]|nr:Txe/YoeB family addiction module toxin [Bacteroidota bacterium]